PFPVILFGSQYWNGLLEWMRKDMIGDRFIKPEDLKRLVITDDPAETVAVVERWYRKGHRKARS
ncbi:MAG: LOG family protein, partial [Dehalococcoidia bacterium]|nr:LOG family protein [Dehalococcoidia bacterium]